jgi:hypothetical protein
VIAGGTEAEVPALAAGGASGASPGTVASSGDPHWGAGSASAAKGAGVRPRSHSANAATSSACSQTAAPAGCDRRSGWGVHGSSRRIAVISVGTFSTFTTSPV